jgi:hypothetical protein
MEGHFETQYSVAEIILTIVKHVCVCLFCVCVILCIGSGLVMGLSLVQGVLPAVYRLRN